MLRLGPLFVLLLIFATGCLEGNFLNGGDSFEPVDENFERLRPALQSAGPGAVREGCDDAPPVLLQSNAVFDQALCLCGDLEGVGDGLTTRSKSHALGEDPGHGHVGINGSAHLVGSFNIGGSFDVAKGFSGVGELEVGQDFITGGDVNLTGDWSVGRDAWINGNIDGIGDVNIRGDLYLSGDLQLLGDANFDVGHRGFAYQSPPCACDPGEVIDVAGEVAAHRSSNDNALLPGGVGENILLLKTGSYYFADEQEFVGHSEISVEGRVSIFVEGDLSSVGDLNINVAPGGEVSLWVAGSIFTVGNLNLGTEDASRPRSFKLYMGGCSSC